MFQFGKARDRALCPARWPALTRDRRSEMQVGAHWAHELLAARLGDRPHSNGTAPALVLAWRHDVLSRRPVDLSRPIGSSGDGSRATRAPPVSRAESVRRGELDGSSPGLLTFGRPARGERRPCGDEQVRSYGPSVRRSSTGWCFPNDKWNAPGTLLTLSDRNGRGKRRLCSADVVSCGVAEISGVRLRRSAVDVL